MIDDDEDVLLAAKMLLKKQNHHVIIEKNPNKIPFLLNNDTYDVILLDMNFSKDITSGKEGFHWLAQILERDPNQTRIAVRDHSIFYFEFNPSVRLRSLQFLGDASPHRAQIDLLPRHRLERDSR